MQKPSGLVVSGLVVSGRFLFLTFDASLVLVLFALVGFLSPVLASDLDEGISLYVSGDFERAREKFASHLSTHPDDPTALYHLGLTERDALKSKYYFERLMETHPDYPGADAALFEIGLYYYGSPGDLSGLAREEFRRILRDYPRSPFVPRALLYLGLLSNGEGAFAPARETLRKALQADASGEVTPFARAAIAESYLLEGSLDLAIREAEDAWPQKRMLPVGGRLLAIASDASALKGEKARADSFRTLLIRQFPESDEAFRISASLGAASSGAAPLETPGRSGQETPQPPPVPALPPPESPAKALPSPVSSDHPTDPEERSLRSGGPRYLVQIGMFGHTPGARALLERLRASGVKVIHETRRVRGKQLWIFTSGPYEDPEEARRIAEGIDSREHLGCRVKEVEQTESPE